MHAAVLGGFDVVLHVADEEGFGGIKVVGVQDLVDFLALVPHPGVGDVDKGIKAGHEAVGGIVGGMRGAEEKGANFLAAAEFEEFAGVRQFHHGTLGALKLAMEPFLQLRHGHAGQVAVVKLFEWQREFGAKLFQAHGWPAGLGQNIIGSLQDGGQVVDKGARPVKNDVANHGESLREAQAGSDDFSWAGSAD